MRGLVAHNFNAFAFCLVGACQIGVARVAKAGKTLAHTPKQKHRCTHAGAFCASELQRLFFAPHRHAEPKKTPLGTARRGDWGHVGTARGGRAVLAVLGLLSATKGLVGRATRPLPH